MFGFIKHRLAGAFLAASLAVGTAPASAAPVIGFDVAGAPASSATATVSGGVCILCSITTTLDAGLDAQVFALAEGESRTFDFFDITVGGLFALATVDVSATLAFAFPASVAVTGSGSGGFGTLFGVLSGGTLTWNDLPTTVTLANGSAFSVDFSDVSAFGLGNTATVTATVTAVTVAVPEPASLALLGAGLLGLVRRRKGIPAT